MTREAEARELYGRLLAFLESDEDVFALIGYTIVGKLDFSNVKFPHNKRIDFIDCHFTDSVAFHLCSIGQMVISGCQFDELLMFDRVHFFDFFFSRNEVKSYVNFFYSRFKLPVKFLGSDLGVARFDEVKFESEVEFIACSASMIALSHAKFNSSELIVHSMHVSCLEVQTSVVATLKYEKVYWPSVADAKESDILELDLCRAWRARVKKEEDFEAASRWNVIVNELTLDDYVKRGRWVSWMVLFCYKVVSCFNESPSRALMVFCLLLTVPSGVACALYYKAGCPSIATFSELKDIFVTAQSTLSKGVCDSVIAVGAAILSCQLGFVVNAVKAFLKR